MNLASRPAPRDPARLQVLLTGATGLIGSGVLAEAHSAVPA
jgi:hypothetical protein